MTVRFFTYRGKDYEVRAQWDQHGDPTVPLCTLIEDGWRYAKDDPSLISMILMYGTERQSEAPLAAAGSPVDRMLAYAVAEGWLIPLPDGGEYQFRSLFKRDELAKRLAEYDPAEMSQHDKARALDKRLRKTGIRIDWPGRRRPMAE
ncbi:hypothetical protein [Ruegeria sp. HKCCA5426]|uniref:hypothetical protein n=1 Tax=Ruegeria sp. HKCCA5426 TaxID=2682985 RepID=UPI0014878E6C|nr:hypothetical protein [Ruegeria sp. HKCCA5426]